MKGRRFEVLNSYRLTWIAAGYALLTLTGCSETNLLGEVPGSDSGTDAHVQSGGDACPATSPASTDSCPSATPITCYYSAPLNDFCEAVCGGGEGWALSPGCPMSGGLPPASGDDASVPEAGVPDTSALGSSVPEAGVPDTSTPGSPVPEAGVPDTGAGACPTTSPALTDPCPGVADITCNYPAPLQGICTAVCGGTGTTWSTTSGCPSGGGLPTVNPSACPASVPALSDSCPAATLSCFYAPDGGTYVFGEGDGFCGATCTAADGWTEANCH